MESIDLRIETAKLLNYQVEFIADTPHITATIGLFIAGDKKIAEFTISTKSWYAVQIDLPMGIIDSIVQIKDTLEKQVVVEMYKSLKQLPVITAESEKS
jgi:uncharacterized protein (DUF983 family)